MNAVGSAARPRPSRNLVDIGEVARMLNARVDALCAELLPDGQREGHEWSALCPWRGDGRRGSFKIHLTGGKAGVWKDFAAGDSGDALDLVAKTLFAGDKAEAFGWARRWLGIESGDPHALERVRRATPTPAQLDEQQTKEAQDAREAAQRIWLGGEKHLLGTPVDAYLAGRGIVLAELGRLPGAIRYCPRLWHKDSARYWPAMVAAVSAPGGAGFAACHRTWLEIGTDGAVRKAPIEKNKAVLGSFRGGHISLWRGISGKPYSAAPDDIIDISEGIEDGLTIAVSLPEARVIAGVSVSNIGNIKPPKACRAVRVWRQNDTKIETIAQFDRAAQALRQAGYQVLIPPIPRHLKDANDLLQEGG